MKILLVKAAFIDRMHTAIIPPLGLLYLAGSLQKFRCEDEVKLIDCRMQSDADFSKLVQNWKPDVISISALTAALIATTCSVKNSKNAPLQMFLVYRNTSESICD